MSPWAPLIVLAAGLAANAAVQILVCRLSSRQGAWLLSLAVGFGAGLAVVLAAVVAFTTPGTLASWLAVALAYLGYSFFYGNVVNGGRTALRVRILSELREHPAGMTVEEIVASYRPEEMFDTRLERLFRHGQIALREGNIHLVSGPMGVFARLMAAARTLALGRQGATAP